MPGYEEALDECFDRVKQVLLDKRAMYGWRGLWDNPVLQTFLLATGHPATQANMTSARQAVVLSRLSDKVCRLAQQLGHELRGLNTDSEDTVRDILGYAVLLDLVRVGSYRWPTKHEGSLSGLEEAPAQTNRMGCVGAEEECGK